MSTKDQGGKSGELAREVFGEYLLTTRQVAQLFQVAETTVRDWINQGELMAIKFGKGYYISSAALRESKQAKEQQKREEMNTRRLEQARRTRLAALKSHDRAAYWRDDTCIWCSSNPVFTTRDQRLDGNVMCEDCTRLTNADLLTATKDSCRRRVTFQVEELNRVAEEEYDDSIDPPFWFLHNCGYCKAPYSLSRAQAKDQAFSPLCLHYAPYGNHHHGQLMPEEAFHYIRRIELADLAQVEASVRNLEKSLGPHSVSRWEVCACACCGEDLAVARQDERLIGATRCRNCREASLKPEKQLAVILQALLVARSTRRFKERLCTPCGCHPEVIDVTERQQIVLSWCDELDRNEREALAERYAQEYSLSDQSKENLINDMAMWDFWQMVAAEEQHATEK